MMSRIITILVSFFLLGGGGYAGYTYFTKPKPQTYVVCPSDVKQCRDGIGVGRISPSCEFAPCPEERPEGTGGIKVLTGSPLIGKSTQTLEAVRENGGDYTCVFKKEEDIKGVLYVSQGELRGDLDPMIKPNIRSVATHVILGKTKTYVWSDIKTSGVAFRRGDMGEEERVRAIISVGLSDPLSVDCKVWSRDSSVFIPPPDIQFEDAALSGTSRSTP